MSTDHSTQPGQPVDEVDEVEPFDEAPPFDPAALVRSLRAAGAEAAIENTGGNCLAVVTETTNGAGEACVVATTDDGAARYTRTAWHDSGEPDALRVIDGPVQVSDYVEATLDLLGT